MSIIYECGICGCYHPWNWEGDCRDDANRFGSPEDFAERKHVAEDSVEVRSMEERAEHDNRAHPEVAAKLKKLLKGP